MLMNFSSGNCAISDKYLSNDEKEIIFERNLIEKERVSDESIRTELLQSISATVPTA